MRCQKVRYFVALLAVFMGCSVVQAQDDKVEYFAPQNVYRFAMHLYEEGDYLRAAGELQRYFYHISDRRPTEADSILYRIALSYRLAGRIPKGIEYFQKVIDEYPRGAYADRSSYQIALSHYLSDSYDESVAFLKDCLSDVAQDKIRLRMYRLEGVNYLKRREWDKALHFVESLDSGAREDSGITQITEFARRGQRLPRKSEFLAGLFSSVIPGSGKMYANRPKDGLFSVLMIGLTAWQAHDGFRKDGNQSLKGWLFGTASAVLYLGNIYGSVVAARMFNEQQEEKLLVGVGITINVDFR